MSNEQTMYAVWLIVFVISLIELALCFILAIIPSKIAKNKGYSAAGFYWFGVGALPAAIIVACVLRNRNAAPAAQQASVYTYPQDPPTYSQNPSSYPQDQSANPQDPPANP
ncbi:MAG: hypothetical protein ILO68_04640 [Clostridia bacterium]|nr:hypothetical protein [Clostridia bacterium]